MCQTESSTRHKYVEESRKQVDLCLSTHSNVIAFVIGALGGAQGPRSGQPRFVRFQSEFCHLLLPSVTRFVQTKICP